MEITKEIVEQIEQVRSTGRTNMMDRRAVQSIANDLDGFALVLWIEETTTKDYVKLLDALGDSR